MFSSVDNFLIEKIHRKIFIAKTIVDHLKALEIQFRTYFVLNIDLQKIVWIQKPFWIGLSDIDHLPLKAQEEFAELSCDSNLKLQFRKKPLIEFWIGTRTEIPKITDMALNVLLPFNTTYLCEVLFSALTHIKSQYRSAIRNVEEVLHPAHGLWRDADAFALQSGDMNTIKQVQEAELEAVKRQKEPPKTGRVHPTSRTSSNNCACVYGLFRDLES
ncbi:hypothetical protein QYM36_018585 [Artemia franciscana]|uniref:HAT C-terminal dimerisation domain-containing protein n=1 Tax=Artemia franciscana TaxID=6661 RepID=A0AA88H253_ARTSF|nr:hypothetical protein QYM36_018585 [Artemia franciscana]